MIGKKLLHYEIVDKLGEGGMGEVYRARDTKLGRDVALKILPEEMGSDVERRRRFEREARLIAALNHPNIVTIHSVEEVDGRLFLTMELVRGKTLRSAIAPGGMLLETFFSTAVPLVDAVCSAHGEGITHRDLKPANVMLSEEGRLKVLDFGLAKLLEQAPSEEDDKTMGMDADTAEGHVMGTVSYMSPEQVEGKAVDARSDIFSLGILFYEMLTGERPFAGDSNASTISAILRDTPPPVNEVREHLPNHLGRIIRRCLAKEPDRRYQTSLDLRNDLQELKEDVDSGHVAVGPSVGSGATAAGATSTAPAPSSDAPSAGPDSDSTPSGEKTVPSDSIVLPGSRRTVGWVVGLAALAIIAVLIIVGVRNRGADAPTTASVESASSTADANVEQTVGVIGFENLSDPNDSENLGRVLMGLVTTHLAEVGGMKVASTAKVLTGRRQAGADDKAFDISLAAAAARHAGADIMLVGQVIRDGERMIITSELVDVSTGNVLGSFKEQAASNSELFALAEAIADDVRDELDVTVDEAAAGDFDLARSLTNSPEAYRYYVSGEVALQQGQYAAAMAALDQAIEVDPTFALAYMRRMLAATWGGDLERGIAKMKVGLAYIDRLPDHWQAAYRALLDFHEGNADNAYNELIALAEAGIDVPDAYDLLGEIATHHSKYQDVKRSREWFERALEADPTHEVVFYHLVEAYIAMHDFEALEELIARHSDSNVVDPRVVGAELALWESQHRYAEVLARLEAGERRGSPSERRSQQARCYEALGRWDSAFAFNDSLVREGQPGHLQGFVLMQRASSQIGRGNFAAAVADYDEAAEHTLKAQMRAGWANDMAAMYFLSQTHILRFAGDLDGALEAAHKAVNIDPDKTRAYLVLMQVQLLRGEVAEAEAALRHLKSVRTANLNPIDPFYVLMGDAVWAKQEGRFDEALDLLRSADAMPIETRHPWVQWEIEAQTREAMGDRDGAIRVYERLLEPPNFLVHLQFINKAYQIPFHYELARLLDAAGRGAEAREHYEAYLARWGEADVPIANADRARARLADL